MRLQITYLIYKYKEDLVLNNLHWLICHQTQPNQIICTFDIRGTFNKFPDFFCTGI